MSFFRVFFIFCFIGEILVVQGQHMKMIEDIRTDGHWGQSNLDAGSDPDHLITFKDRLYLVANNQIQGPRLWMWDEVDSMRMDERVKHEITSTLMLFEEQLCFTGIDLNGVSGLWRYDGENEPELLAEGAFVAFHKAYTQESIVYKGQLYFTGAQGGNENIELWRYSNASGLEAIHTYANTDWVTWAHRNPHFLRVYNGYLFYVGRDEVYAEELWRYDGESDPFVMTNVNPSGTGLQFGAVELHENDLYFTTSNGVLWKYNGWGFPKRVSELVEDYPETIQARYLHSYDQKLFFTGKDSASGWELWSFDGSNAPQNVIDIVSGSGDANPIQFYTFSNAFYFAASSKSDNDWGEREVYRYRAGGVVRMTTFDSRDSKRIGNFIEHNGHIFFTVREPQHGEEVWRLRNTMTSELVDDIVPITNMGAQPFKLTVLDDKIYFITDYDDHWRRMLYRYDPSSREMEQLVGNYTIPFPLYEWDNLWRNGDGTYPVMSKGEFYLPTRYLGVMKYNNVDRLETVSAIPFSLNEFPMWLTDFQDKLFLTAYDSIDGNQIWMYDGEDSAASFRSLYPDIKLYNPSDLIVFKNKLYFHANDSVHGAELWGYDGFSPPQLVMDIQEGEEGSNPIQLTVTGEQLYFQANDGIHGAEIWVYDGVGVPELLVDALPGVEGSAPDNFLYIQDQLMFSALTNTTNAELWSYSEADGVQHITDLGSPLYTVVTLLELDNRLYFTKSNQQLYMYDGSNPPELVCEVETPTGELLQDWCSKVFRLPVAHESGIYFSGKHPIFGEELFQVKSDVWTSISGIEQGESLRYYPNPSQGIVYISLDHDHEKLHVQVLDITGKIVRSDEFVGQKDIQVSLTGEQGLYFVKINAEGRLYPTLKVLKL